MRVLMALAAVSAAAAVPVSAPAETYSPPASVVVPYPGSTVFWEMQMAISGSDLLLGSGPSLFAYRGDGLTTTALPPVAPRSAETRLVTGGSTTVAAWRRDSPKPYAGIEAAVRSVGGTWSAPMVIADEAAGGSRAPALAVDEQGAAVVAFVHGTHASHLNLNGGVAVSYRPRGGAFSAPQIISPRGSAPKVAIGGDGQAAVTWREFGRVRAVLLDRRGVGVPRTLGRGQDQAVAIRADGAALVAWTRYVAHVNGRVSRATGIVEAAFRPPGGRFGRPRRVAAIYRTSFTRPRIVIAGARAVVTWAGHDTPGGHARTRLWQRAVPGSAPPAVLVDGISREYDSEVIGRPDGRLAAVWTTRGGHALPLRPWAGSGAVGTTLHGVRLDGPGPPPGSQVGQLAPTPDSSDVRITAGPGAGLTVAWRTYGPDPGSVRVSITQGP
jgi:hypothetical protein